MGRVSGDAPDRALCVKDAARVDWHDGKYFRDIKVSECPVEELIIKIKRKGLFLWENK